MLSANLSAIFYLISGVLFILALRGLSSPETSRQGNFFGILGMAIAVTVTFLSIGNFSTGFVVVLIFLLIGGLIGAFIAYKIPMTAMPELVAGFHSLVGLAAVFVAIAAFLNPEAFNLGPTGNIKLGSLIEMSNPMWPRFRPAQPCARSALSRLSDPVASHRDKAAFPESRIAVAVFRARQPPRR